MASEGDSTAGGAERIVVMARVRPPLPREESFREVVGVEGNDILVAHGEGHTSRSRFDHVFDRHASQEDVFARTRPFIESCLEGYHTTLFAYGQTVRAEPPGVDLGVPDARSGPQGTGKTHTMLGVDLWQLATAAGSQSGGSASRAPRPSGVGARCVGGRGTGRSAVSHTCTAPGGSFRGRWRTSFARCRLGGRRTLSRCCGVCPGVRRRVPTPAPRAPPPLTGSSVVP